MIEYTEKGPELHDLVGRAGHSLAKIDGVWVSSDDVVVQAIIDAYDPLLLARSGAITMLKKACEAHIVASHSWYNQINDVARAIELLMKKSRGQMQDQDEVEEVAHLIGNYNWVNAVRTESRTHEALINSETDWMLCEVLAKAGISALQEI